MALQTATNSETGERVALVGNRWVPIEQTATNPKTGAKAYLVNNEWVVDEVAAKPAEPTPSKLEPKPEPKPEPESIFRQVADVPLAAAKGVTQGVRMIADFFGAGSDTSKNIKGVENYITNLMSAQSKNDSKEIARIMKDAEDKGVLENVKAAFKAFTVAPVDMTAQALGTSAPTIIAALGATLFAPATAVGTVAGATALGLGAVMGAGTVKGTIYEETKKALKEAGIKNESQIEEIAVKAQEYKGKNLDMILVGAGLGALAGRTGAERQFIDALSKRILTKAAAKEAAKTTATTEVAKEIAKKAPKTGVVAGAKKVVTEAGKEAIPEFAQAGQEKIAENVALQRVGEEEGIKSLAETPTMRGAVGAATLEALVGAALGGGLSAREAIQIARDQGALDEDIKNLERKEPELKTEALPVERKEPTFGAEPTNEQQINVLTAQLVQTLGIAEEDARKIATKRINELAVKTQKREDEVEEETETKFRKELYIPDDDPKVQEYAGELLDNNIVSTKEEAIILAKERIANETLSDIQNIIDPSDTSSGEGATISSGPAGGIRTAGIETPVGSGVAGTGPSTEPTVLREEPTQTTVEPVEEAPDITSPPEAVEPVAKTPDITSPPEAVKPVEKTPDIIFTNAPPETVKPVAKTFRDQIINRLSELAEEARELESDKLTDFAIGIDPRFNKGAIIEYNDFELERIVKDIEMEVARRKMGAANINLYPVDQTIAGASVYVDTENLANQYRKTPVDAELIDFNNLLIAPSMNQAKVKLGLPESAKMSNLIDTAQNKGYDGITFSTPSGQQYLRIPSAPSPSQYLGDAPVNASLNKINNAVQGLTIVAQTGNKLQKELANRFKSVATNVPVVVLEKNDPLPTQIANNKVLGESWNVAKAMYVGPSFGQPTIYLRGASFGNQQSVNNVDMLHESGHAALDKKLILAENMTVAQGVINKTSKDPLVQGYAELQETIGLVKQAYDEGVKNNTLDPQVFELGSVKTIDVFNNPREFAAYGISNPAFVKFLKSVKTPAKYSSTGRDKTLFTKFVEAVRKILGLAPNQFNALVDLFDITDRFAATQIRPQQQIIGLVGSSLKTATGRAQKQKSSLTKKVQEVGASTNQEKILKLLGPQLYGEFKNMSVITLKELVQNSFDAIKGSIDKKIIGSGNITINVNSQERTITVIDDGSGMPSSVMGKEFLQIAGTVKETDRASGGFGIAKALFLFGSEELEVISLRDGVLSRINTTGKEVSDSMMFNPAAALETLKPYITDPDELDSIKRSIENNIEKRKTAGEKIPSVKLETNDSPEVIKSYSRVFPKGHGTVVRVKIPETYVDVNTGKTENINFNEYDLKDAPVLTKSPLFEKITVEFNTAYYKNILPIGTNFPINDYTVFSTIKFNWGQARIYLSKNESESFPYYNKNTAVLSNGLYQFSTSINSNLQLGAEQIQRQFYIDIIPNKNIKPDNPAYPFTLNRSGFTVAAEKEFNKIFNYITLTNAFAEYGKEAVSFGEIVYIEPDGKFSAPIELKPEKPATPTGLSLISPNDKIEIKNGIMYVNNRQVPDISIEDVEKIEFDIDELKIPQDKIDPTRVIVHDNLAKLISKDELNRLSLNPLSDVAGYAKDATGVIYGYKVSLTTLAKKEFGARFDAYLKEVGDIFMQLREVLVMSDSSYAALEKEAIGISFDKDYYGVSIRIPFRGSFLNPATTYFQNKGTPAQIALSMIGTMIHELAHFKIRNHGAEFSTEMQLNITYLDTMPGFDLADVKNSFAKFLTKNMDIYNFLNEEFTSGNFGPSGRSFKEASYEQVGDARITEPVEGAGGKGKGGQGVPGGAKQSSQGVESVGLPAGVSGEAAERRAARTQKEIDNEVDEAIKKYETSKRAEDLAKQATLIYSLRNRKNIFPALAAIWRGTNYRIRQGLVKPITNDFLAEWAGKDIPRFLEINRQLQELGGMTRNMMAAAGDLSRFINDAYRNDPTLQDKINKLTKVTTLAQVDPKVDLRNQKINELYNDLGPKGKRIYNDVKQYFNNMVELYGSLLDDQINAANISPEAKTKLLASIKKIYEGKNKLDPYFPLMRDGNFWLSVYVGNTKDFFMFSTMAERDAVATQMATDRKNTLDDLLETKKFELGNDIRSLRQASTKTINGQNPSAILKAAFDLVDNANFTETTVREDMKDAIYQLYLRTMPEQSFRKQFIARKGYAGFRTDFLRDFNESALKMSVQLARLKYAPKLRNSLLAARESIQNRPELEPFMFEMERRVAETLNPNTSNILDKIASFINRLSFIYYLSGASSALLQPLGIFQTGIPILGARHGYGATAAEMAKLMKVWDQYGIMRKTATGNSVWSPPSIVNASGLTTDERAAVESMLARDVTQTTYARALFEYKNIPTEKFNSVAERGKYYANMLVGGLLHSTERLSREILFIASYRLSKRKKMSNEAAINQAVQDTNDALGNYGDYNRPLIMRNAGGKIMLQFQMYPLHVTLYLLKNFKRMIPFLNKEGKLEAAKIFWGTMATTYVLAGANGLPGFSPIMGLLGLAWGLADDDEKPKDVKDIDYELWFRTQFLPEILGNYKINGKNLSDIVERGPMNALTGWDLSSRTSLNDLWFRDIKETKTAREELLAYAIERAGPGVNMMLNFADSYEAFRDGDYKKGVEKLSPALIRNLVLTHKYATEGAKDNKGAQIMSKDAFTTGELIGQAIGFRSDLLANTQNVTFKLIGIQQRIENERQKLFDNIDREYRTQNIKAYSKLITEDLVEFNKKYPSFKIDIEQLQASLERRAKDRGESWRGLRLSEKNAALLAPSAAPSRKAVAERERQRKVEVYGTSTSK